MFGFFKKKKSVDDSLPETSDNEDPNESDADKYQRLLTQGKALAESGDTQNAIQHFIAATFAIPEHAAADVEIGRLFMGQGQHESAEKSFAAAEELDPDNMDATFYFGLCLFNMKKYEQAITKFDKVLSLDDSDITSYYYRGRSWLALGDKDSARDDLQAAADQGFEKAQLLLAEL